MTRISESLALRIAQLLVEHTEQELRLAVELLRVHGHDSALLDFLAQDNAKALGAKVRGCGATSIKPLHETTSRAVLKLRDNDPETFWILADFDLMVRRGQLLESNEDLRRFGERVSKDFVPRKARRETIGALMAALAERALPDLDQLACVWGW